MLFKLNKKYFSFDYIFIFYTFYIFFNKKITITNSKQFLFNNSQFCFQKISNNLKRAYSTSQHLTLKRTFARLQERTHSIARERGNPCNASRAFKGVCKDNYQDCALALFATEGKISRTYIYGRETERNGDVEGKRERERNARRYSPAKLLPKPQAVRTHTHTHTDTQNFADARELLYIRDGKCQPMDMVRRSRSRGKNLARVLCANFSDFARGRKSVRVYIHIIRTHASCPK